MKLIKYLLASIYLILLLPIFLISQNSQWIKSSLENLATTFTSGSIPFSTGSLLEQDNANLFYDNTNNRLGVGTSSPTTDLTIEGGFSIGDTTGFVLAGGVNVGTATVSGESNVILDTGSAAALDTTTTLTGVVGQIIYISTRNSARDVTFLDNTNFRLGGTRLLTNVDDVLILKAVTTTVWKEIGFLNNG